jgi:hypothetical protein
MVNYWIYTTDGKQIYSNSDKILDWYSVGIKYDAIDSNLVWLSAKFESNSVYVASLYKGVRYKRDGRLERIIVVIELNNIDGDLPQEYYNCIKKIQKETKSNNIIVDWGSEYGEYSTKPIAFNCMLSNLNDIKYKLEMTGILSININELQYSKNPDDKIRYYSLYVFHELYKRLRKEYLGVFSYYTPTNILIDAPLFAISSDGEDLCDIVEDMYSWDAWNYGNVAQYPKKRSKGRIQKLKGALDIRNIKNIIKNKHYRITSSTIKLIIACIVIMMLVVGTLFYIKGNNESLEDIKPMNDLKIVSYIQSNELLNNSIMPFIQKISKYPPLNSQYKNDSNISNDSSMNTNINSANNGTNNNTNTTNNSNIVKYPNNTTNKTAITQNISKMDYNITNKTNNNTNISNINNTNNTL